MVPLQLQGFASKSLRCTASPAFECCRQGSISSCQHIFGRSAVLARRTSGNCSHLLTFFFAIPRTFARPKLDSSSRKGLLCSTGGTKLESHSRSWTSLEHISETGVP